MDTIPCRKFFALPTLLALATPLFCSDSGAQQDPTEIFSLGFEDAEVLVDFIDPNVGGARYSIERSIDLRAAWLGADLAEIGDSPLRLGMRAKLADSGAKSEFFRVRRESVPAVLGFAPLGDSGLETTIIEGADGYEIFVQFQDADGNPIFYTGPVHFSLGGDTDAVTNLTGQVMASGGMARIPLEVVEEAGISALRGLTLELISAPGSPYAIDPSSASVRVNIADDDAYWRGFFEVGGERHRLVLYIERGSGGSLTVGLDAAETEIVGDADQTSPGGQTQLTENVFAAAFESMSVEASAENLFGENVLVTLTLSANNNAAGQKVSDTAIDGEVTLLLEPVDAAHLTTTLTGRFLLNSDPPQVPTDSVPITTTP
ncbi:MAG: hypothetical protein ACR2RV_20130 [Verrucomicrobiales bacterium]